MTSMRVDISTWELHNLVLRGDELRTRPGLFALHRPTTGTVFVGGFTLESPGTTEPWHYLFERASSTGVVTLRVVTEEFVELFSYDLGPMPQDPVISYGAANNQLVINGPALASPLYGHVGGGVMAAWKRSPPIENPDRTPIDVPTGHVTTFADRMVIAQGSVLYMSEPGTEPRAFAAAGAFAFPGLIYDVVEGSGGLWVFTSTGTFVLSADTPVTGGVRTAVPGIQTARPRNAAASGGVVAVLQSDRLVLFTGPGTSQEVPLQAYRGRRRLSRAVEQGDLRLSGEVLATPTGFIVAFRGKGPRGYCLALDVATGFRSWVWALGAAVNPVGVLRSRDGEALLVLDGSVVVGKGNDDSDGGNVDAVACARLDLPEDAAPVIRHITVSSEHHDSTVKAYVSGVAAEATPIAPAGSAVIGTALWSSTELHGGRDALSVRMPIGARVTDPSVEVAFKRLDRRVERHIVLELSGQGRGRRDVR